jgi:hypothetical protein
MSDSQPPAANPETQTTNVLPLDELQLTPEWVKAPAPSYRGHAGNDHEERRRDRGFRDRDRGPRPDRPPRPKADRPRERPPRPPGEQPRVAAEARDRTARAAQPHPPAETAALIEVAFIPEEKGFAAMLTTMRESRRAYALFDLAKLVLNKPERHQVKLTRRPAADGTRAPLYLAVETGNVFLSQDQAMRSIFQRHPELVCRETRTPIDPPKGNFVFVNRCGFTGEVLGPPNYHEYQSRLVRHHQERLRHMPFEQFKSRIQTIRDPEAVKAWIESMSVKIECECLLDAEPKKFASREELQHHVAAEHLDKLVGTATEVIISGQASRTLEHAGILDAIREAWLSERRFPLRTANGMQARLRHEGFHFFKHRKGITYITAVKPKRFEAGQTLTEHVQKIIALLRANQRWTRKQLIDTLLSPADGAAAVPSGNPSPAPVAEQSQLLADLHWLIQDGYVVEFHDGRLTVLEDRPPKPAPPPAPAAAPAEPPVAQPEPVTADQQPAPNPEPGDAAASEPPAS